MHLGDSGEINHLIKQIKTVAGTAAGFLGLDKKS